MSETQERSDVLDITEGFADSLLLSQESVLNKNDFHSSLYKNRNHVFADQEKRRKLFLEEQKKKRSELQMKLRAIVDESSDEETPMECHSAFGNVRTGRTRKYKNVLMLSEWLVEVPSDFVVNWTLVLCPVGKRCVVVASKGYTKMYARNGYLMKSFTSHLPGGNHGSDKKYKNRCVLDCIYVESDRMFFVLDIICWNDVSFYDSETEFRFYWISSKLSEECPHISESTETNPYTFHTLPRFQCDFNSILEAIKKPRLFKEMDGLLFFHKKCVYTAGISPLVCWLKEHMLNDVFKDEKRIVKMEDDE